MTPSYKMISSATSINSPVVRWRKSSRSNKDGSCVEVAPLGRGGLARDSKDPHGPVLAFASSEWARLLNDIKAGKLNLP